MTPWQPKSFHVAVGMVLQRNDHLALMDEDGIERGPTIVYFPPRSRMRIVAIYREGWRQVVHVQVLDDEHPGIHPIALRYITAEWFIPD